MTWQSSSDSGGDFSSSEAAGKPPSSSKARTLTTTTVVMTRVYGCLARVSLRLGFRLWASVVVCERQAELIEDMREAYASTIADWREERRRDGLLEEALRERDVAARERAEATRERNFYRAHAEALERELDELRRTSRRTTSSTADHRQHCADKYVAYLKGRRTKAKDAPGRRPDLGT
eukprot:CAMPEP_0118901958 /NCGR_PEP_ID=MMETSP1166-20130328/7454_1 /TAXON_ID=1104430 /ORGANISM="Chrysoreinhardia sp, Strain CCMP3193" /LENGTH=177 /DNA_ID=CAMNT_0006841149 /DNA_START=98 /DNA_END=631 /DNA_ORIENTATION=+